MMNGTRYRGRFAPSPTGPLHFGSLVAAVGSWLEARVRGGEWLLRVEDLDRPRCSSAAADQILRALDAYGLTWDGPVVWQSERDEAYRDALEKLRSAGRVFPCACTRRELADSALAPDGAQIYPGTCRHGLPSSRAARAWRLRVDSARVGFEDLVQGRIDTDLARDVGDFVLKRADGLFAYQLAVVVDDAAVGVTHVVRGADLLASTARQIFLQHCLGLPTPVYAHLPAAINSAGEKLSKQTRAAALDCDHPVPSLVDALTFLGQAVPRELADANVSDVWDWALGHWLLSRVRRVATLPYNRSDRTTEEVHDARG